MSTDYQAIYILGGGMLLQERKLDVVSNNLANVDTPSFKKDFLTSLSYYAPDGIKAPNNLPSDPSNNYVYSVIEDVRTILSQGSLVKTDNPLDFAIEGEGFFAVLDEEGNIIYTRKGIFRINEEGLLTTEEGYFVLDENLNPIAVPGEISVTSEGEIFLEGNPITRFGIFSLTNSQKVGEDFFTGTPTPAQDYKIFQGFYEASNVNAIKEVVKIIETVRVHEIFSKLIQMNDEIQGKVNNII